MNIKKLYKSCAILWIRRLQSRSRDEKKLNNKKKETTTTPTIRRHVNTLSKPLHLLHAWTFLPQQTDTVMMQLNHLKLDVSVWLIARSNPTTTSSSVVVKQNAYAWRTWSTQYLPILRYILCFVGLVATVYIKIYIWV